MRARARALFVARISRSRLLPAAPLYINKVALSVEPQALESITSANLGEMAIPRSLMLELSVLVCFLALLAEPATAGFNPAEFPNGFYYGSSTAAYQV